MKRKGQGAKGTEKATLANLAAGRRAGSPPRSQRATVARVKASAPKRAPGRPPKYELGDKPQRLGVYLPADLLAWIFEETARRKRERRDASASEIVADALAAYRKGGDR